MGGEGFGLLVATKDARIRPGIFAWIVFTGLSLRVGRKYSAELAFVGFVCLLAHVLRLHPLVGATVDRKSFAFTWQLNEMGSAF